MATEVPVPALVLWFPVPEEGVCGLSGGCEQCLGASTRHTWHWSPDVCSWQGCWESHGVWMRGAHLDGGDEALTSSLINANSSGGAAPIDQQPKRTVFTKPLSWSLLQKGWIGQNPHWNKSLFRVQRQILLPVALSCLHQLPSLRKLPSYNQEIFFKWLWLLKKMWRSWGCFLPPSSKIHFHTDQYLWRLKEKTGFGNQTLSAWKQGRNKRLCSSAVLRSRIYHCQPRLASLSFFSWILPFSDSHFFFVEQEGKCWIKISTWHIHALTV